MYDEGRIERDKRVFKFLQQNCDFDKKILKN